MKSFSDFMRYKGTIKFVRSIGSAFSDVMSYYELYIDYDESYINPRCKFLFTVDKDLVPNGSYCLISSTKQEYYIWFNLNNTALDPFGENNSENKIGIEIKLTDNISSNEIADQIINALNATGDFFVNINSTDVVEVELSEHGPPINAPSGMTTNLVFKIIEEGKTNGAWILRPKPIYIHPKMEKIEEFFTYQEAYEKIPTLLLPESQLTKLKQDSNIVLPTKSNIILLDYTSSISGNYLNLLFFTILMENIGEDLFPVFFTGSDGTTTITYNMAFLLWYYLVAKYYNITLEGVDLSYYNVMGTKKITNFLLSDIPRLEEEYNKIENREDLYRFYMENIEEPFNKKYANEKPTIAMMGETLRRLDPELFEYVENRLATAENLEQDVRYLLDEIYASIVLSFDRYQDNEIIYKYIPIILEFLTQITTSIRATDSYKIIYNMKPFHTEILDLARNKIIIDDKFNALLFGDQTEMFYWLMLADILHYSDKTLFTFTPKKDASCLHLASWFLPSYLFFNQDALNLTLQMIYNFFYTTMSCLNWGEKQTIRVDLPRTMTSINFITIFFNVFKYLLHEKSLTSDFFYSLFHLPYMCPPLNIHVDTIFWFHLPYNDLPLDVEIYTIFKFLNQVWTTYSLLNDVRFCSIINNTSDKLCHEFAKLTFQLNFKDSNIRIFTGQTINYNIEKINNMNICDNVDVYIV